MQDDMEIWRDIEGYEGIYQVSNHGRVRSLDRFILKRGFSYFVKGRILKPKREKDNYVHICLSKNGIHKYIKIHRLVWGTFVGPIPNGLQVNHIDENPRNNRLDNLNLLSPKENSNWGSHNSKISMKKTGRCGMRNRKDQSKPVSQFTKDGDYIATYPSIHQASKDTGIHISHISACCQHKVKIKNGQKYVTRTAGGYIWSYAS